jgi:hypothetical protein
MLKDVPQEDPAILIRPVRQILVRMCCHDLKAVRLSDSGLVRVLINAHGGGTSSGQQLKHQANAASYVQYWAQVRRKVVYERLKPWPILLRRPFKGVGNSIHDFTELRLCTVTEIRYIRAVTSARHVRASFHSYPPPRMDHVVGALA